MTTPHTFSGRGARRIVAAVRAVEENDPRHTAARPARQPSGPGRHEFVIARVTGADPDNPLLVHATEQYWSDADGNFIDVDGGRVWDGEEGNLLPIFCATLPGVDDLVALGHRYGPDGQTWYVVPGGSWSFWAKITGSAANGTNKWKYAWTEQARSSTGWSDKSNGRSGTTGSGFALNACEANNDGSGIQGNSMDIDGDVFDDNSDLEIQPVQGDPVVRVYGEIDDANGVAYSFEYVNAVDGECA